MPAQRPEPADLSDPGAERHGQDSVAARRKELGSLFKQARIAAGLSQASLARRLGYARSSVSSVESGSQHAARPFWEICDGVLATGTRLTTAYDEMAQLMGAGRVERTAAPAVSSRFLSARTTADAMSAYRELGWQADAIGGQVHLVCGAGVEALEVPRPAGVVAARWWLHTGGTPDETRGLPRLPGPRDALTVIAVGDRWLFLVQSGGFPWIMPAPAVTPERGVRQPAVIWHGAGSRIPAPPTEDAAAPPVTWAYSPETQVRLADPIMLLDLLARAMALAGRHDHRMIMPGGVAVIPARHQPGREGQFGHIDR